MKLFNRDKKIVHTGNASALRLIVPAPVPFIKNDQAEDGLREVCCKGLVQVLLELGLEEKQEDNGSIDVLRKKLSIDEKYSRLFHEIIRFLGEMQYLHWKDGKITFSGQLLQELEHFTLEEVIDRLTAVNKEYTAHTHLIRECLGSLREILTGKKRATDVIFPGGKLDYVSGIYKGNYQSDYFNALLSDIIVQTVSEGVSTLGEGEKIRILEVGAGTGGTSEIIFRKLAPFQSHLEYVYTDVSRSFLIYAEETYKGIAPYLRTALFNIEQSPVSQGLAIGAFDLIIGANVVHATKNITATLDNIKALLKKDGILILNEIARTELFTTLTFGLLDGWWLYEDASLRLQGSPGLSADGWKKALTETGFYETVSLPEEGNLSQQVVVARSNGAIVIPATKPVNPTKSAPAAEIKQADLSHGIPADNSWLIDQLIAIASDTVKIPREEFNIDEQFTEYGFDSILGTTFMKNINEALNITLKATDIFSYPNIAQLAGYIQENYGDRLLPEMKGPENPEPAQMKDREVRHEKRKRNRFSGQLANTTVSPVSSSLDIAIVGMSGRFGAAGSLEDYWSALKKGKSLIEEVSSERWDSRKHFSPDTSEANKTYSKWGGFLRDVDKFDPVFFRISGTEAETMDPQQRLFLEHCWKAIEDAAIHPQKLKAARCGVFVGAGSGDYITSIDNKAPSAFWGNSSSILASRISYLLDLKGPAISIDTACSSSLVAMDLGCASLRKGDTDIVISGGVTVMNTPNFYKLASRAGMLSPTGQCYTFDKRADGFVPGEGVGVVVMKRLEDAVRDGDPIYGVIKGSLTNQDGTTNGITAPSALSQMSLEKEVYAKCGIHPETITYVEAHGTGTRLGDPIEFEALTGAFRSYTDRRQYCSIGSVKTNIGHTLMAAGVAGVIKIMLSFRHKQLVPTINYQECNPLIDLAGSPFRIQDKLEPWQPEGNIPRRAVVSSFGFSGTNAHLVLEEYVPAHEEVYRSNKPALVVLSAKNEERLREHVENLKNFIDSNPQVNIHDLAYTLQTGREAMEERLGMVVHNTAQLKENLKRYLLKQNSGRRGNTRDGKEQLKLVKGFLGERLIGQLYEKEEYEQLLDLWCAGAVLSWDKVYGPEKPSRVHLPTYPFARESYWITSEEIKKGSESPFMLHPLLHHNESDLKEQKYTSIFTGRESFLAHHKVGDIKILPGVAYLELAREAGSRSMKQPVTRLKDVTWLTPIRVEDAFEKIYISLYPSGTEVGYEVYSTKEGNEVLHSQGKLTGEISGTPERYNIQAIRERLGQSLERDACYRIFGEKGLNLGSSFRGIETLYYSEEAALSRICLPREEGFVLTPGILDSALQTGMGLHLHQENKGLALPFSVKEVTIYRELPEVLWSYARKSAHNKETAKVTSYDFDLLNEAGEVVISFTDFVVLPLDGFRAEQPSTKEPAEIPATSLFMNRWTRAAIETANPRKQTAEQLILLAGAPAGLADKLKEVLEVEVELLQPAAEVSCFLNILERVKEKIRTKEEVNILLLCSHSDYLDYGFISGLFRTANLENPKVTGKIVAVERLALQDLEELAAIIGAEQDASDTEVRYRQGIREIRSLQELTAPAEDARQVEIKEGGVYLITGGAGGLGKVFASHIGTIKNTATVLTGRSALSPEKVAELSEIPGVEYMRCDVSNREDVNSLIQYIRNKYRQLDGIIHSAGSIRDSFISQKTLEEVHEVLSPKVAGVKNLDEATKEVPLDFMVLFSSLSGVTGNIGQADYASANAYLDNYAIYRNALVAAGKRHGKTISINWPLWKEGGMQIGEETLRLLEKQSGMMPLPAEEGIKAFEQLLNSGLDQGLVVYGRSVRIGGKAVTAVKAAKREHRPAAVDTTGLQEKAALQVLDIVAKLLKLDVKVIRRDKELGDYGFDSILLTKFCNELNSCYDLDLMPTVFFNYPTVDSLAAFLAEEHPAELLKRHGSAEAPAKIAIVPQAETVEQKGVGRKSRFLENTLTKVSEREDSGYSSEPVAIVGISGRFPGSPDLETFWENIRSNKDLISEIPADRWDWKKYYGDPRTEKNKTKAKWGGFIEDIDKFDPLFFNISPKEAELMDPQQRITLEAVYTALEDAGISPDDIRGSNAGAFIGVSTLDYTAVFNRQSGLAREALFSTGSAHSVLVNRISYLLDIHGPSEPIDTACSSSLIAIHRAVENIRNGNCDLAIAGGVNALLAPEVTLSFSQAGMLSDDGRCKTFDQAANGYVRGEGVGVIILKPLRKARKDGDRIYAVIRETAENHGGKANSLTSPNPVAQKDLLLKAYRKANIDPRNITFIEAHGTGTSLGDPVEIEGLKLVFKELYKERGLGKPENRHCGLSSVKTNIGHLEAAAGIAGIIKVIFALKHKMLPGNPHLQNPNQYLKLDDSPLYLLKETREWKTTDNSPRIAGVSSFGFGGANAHVILEEYIPQVKKKYIGSGAVIIPLSARNEARLKDQARNLKRFLEKNPAAGIYDIAYTLQTGRKPMEERLAIVAIDREDLTKQLSAYLEGVETSLLRGNLWKEKSDFDLEGEQKYLRDLIANQDLTSLTRLWVKGAAMDWSMLYRGGRPDKIALPTYPFARERYWIKEQKDHTGDNNAGRLHPLVHYNDSTLKEQCFTTILDGSESFLADHRVKEGKILPGVAYIEMVREAVTRSAGQEVTCIKDVTWLRPVVVKDNPEKVHVRIYPSGEEIAYEVYSEKDNQEQVHSQGKASILLNDTPVHYDLASIRARLTQSMSSEALYSFLGGLGLYLGSSFRGIQQLYYSREEALSRIVLPEQKGFYLIPGVMDCGLQTTVGLNINNENPGLALPFTAREVKIYNSLPSELWAYTRRSVNNKPGKTSLDRYDIDFLNEQGEVILSINEIVAIKVDSQGKQNIQRSGISDTLVGAKEPGCIYLPFWNRPGKRFTALLRKTGTHLLVTGGEQTAFSEMLETYLRNEGCDVKVGDTLPEVPEGISCVYLLQGLTGKQTMCSPEEGLERREFSVFRWFKALQDSGYAEQPLDVTLFTGNTQKVLSSDYVEADGAGIIGLAGSLAKEQSGWKIRMIDLDSDAIDNPDLSKIITAPFDNEGPVLGYRKGNIYRRSLLPATLYPSGKSRLRKEGTYVILGGAGGLGKVTTEYLVKEYNAQVIWLGRSPVNEDIAFAFDSIGKAGKRPEYIQCDANDRNSLTDAYRKIKERFKEVNGLYHAAIVLEDMLLRNMSEESFKKAIAPKSLASHYLVEVFREEPLDFVVFYSSTQSQFCAAGQSNYAAGCTYKDSYALSISNKYNIPAYVINWGYWGDVGIVSSEAYRQRMEGLGFRSISPEEGMNILESFLAGIPGQVIVLKVTPQLQQKIKFIASGKEMINASSCASVATGIPEMIDFRSNEEAERALNELCLKGMLQVLLRLGFDEKRGQELSVTALGKTLGVEDKYDRLFHECIRSLEEAGYLTKVNNIFQVSAAILQELESFNLDTLINTLISLYPEYTPHGNLIRICLGALKEILAGKKRAIDVIFPGGSLEHVSGIYQGNYQADYFNNLLADIIERSILEGISHLKEGEKIRILEVGAGTGGTSRILFERLSRFKNHIEYVYTDLSKSFLLYGEKTYKNIAPYLKTAMFNIEQSPTVQDLPLGAFDLVVGANVVHATRNIAATLGNIKAVLKKEGLLVMNELARTEIFSTLTFGLLDGWWLFEDEEIRLKGSPGLSPENWNTVLSETGYTNICSYPKGRTLSQQIVVAGSNGYAVVPSVAAPEEKLNGAGQHKHHEVLANQKTEANIINDNTVQKATKMTNGAWITDQLISIAAETIKLPKEDFNVDRQFMDYGFDSILGTTFMKNVNEKLKISLSTTDIFNYPNIGELSKYIQETFAEQLKQNVPVKSAPLPEVQQTEKTGTLKTRFSDAAMGHSKAKMVTAEVPGRSSGRMDIAVIGMSGQFGAADNLEEYWNAMKAGKSLIEQFPSDRWELDKYYSPDRTELNKSYSKWGSFVRDIDKFDPMFFRISGAEAELMDPQQRFFLQHCWKAIEDAAINPRSLKGKKCSVYVGVGQSDYMGSIENKAASVFWGNSSSILASRISYLLDLKGPAVPIDTACSSSLVAIDMGCTCLMTGDVDLVIAGGVNVRSTPAFYVLASRAGMLSPDGQCYTFDSRANGFVPGEGVGIVILKRLEDAERDGDHIYGVIRGSMTNQDGTTNGIIAPSAVSQMKLEKDIYEKYKIDPETINYVEAHGTGTGLGDPIEFQALSGAFKSFTDKKQFCGLGSVKTNIGHALTAAGVASVIKMMLALKHKQLPPSINYRERNPLIDLENSPFKIQESLENWQASESAPRRAAISSFGFSGTNAHLVVEEYDSRHKTTYSSDVPAIILLSAKDRNRLKELAENLKRHIDQNPGLNIYDIAYTLQVGREPMEERIALITSGVEDLSGQLMSYIENKPAEILKGNIRKDKLDFLLEGGAGQAYLQYAIEHREVKSLAQLWVKGVQIDWDLLYPHGKPGRISLPTYSFAKERYWNFDLETTASGKETAVASILQIRPELSLTDGIIYEVNLDRMPSDLPHAATIELVLQAARALFPGQAICIREHLNLRSVSVKKDKVLHLCLNKSGDEVVYKIVPARGGTFYAAGNFSLSGQRAEEYLDLIQLKGRLQTDNSLRSAAIRSSWKGQGEGLFLLNAPKDAGDNICRFITSASLVQSAFYCMSFITGGELFGRTAAYKATEIMHLGKTDSEAYSYIQRRPEGNFWMVLADKDGKVFVKFASLEPSLEPDSERIDTPVSESPSEENGMFRSSTALERATEYIKSLFSRILKIEESRLSADTSFEDLGMDSILVNVILSELKKISPSISSVILLESRTINDLADHLASSFEAEPEMVYTNDHAHLAFPSLQKPGLQDRCLHTFRNGDEQPPVFIIPGTPGICAPYFPLAQGINYSGPVFGLNWKGVFEGDTPFASIQEIASHNIQLIDKVYKNSPVHLIGHSYGAVIIYEMLKQYMQQGREMGKIILIDSGPRLLQNHISARDKINMFLGALLKGQNISQEKLEDLGGKILQQPKEARFSFMIKRLNQEGVERPLQHGALEAIYNTYESAMDIAYAPGVFLPFSVRVVKAQVDNIVKEPSGTQGWENYFLHTESLEVPGDHFSLIHASNCKEWMINLNWQLIKNIV